MTSIEEERTLEMRGEQVIEHLGCHLVDGGEEACSGFGFVDKVVEAGAAPDSHRAIPWRCHLRVKPVQP
ncbi:hypothetical protein [Bradyrhizobium oligotrophicum]|uniref:hypothetical protein n=1 Tax=Bradyrhizobium oligotrophicum TaxID=44255 RepID=UPI003EB89BED